MGAVFLAEHTLIGKKAAAKILLPQFSRDAEIVNRFFNEARAATQIRHPGIVEIFDFGYHESGCAYLVMEFLEGESLAMRLVRDGGRLSEPWLVEVSRQVASALRAAHEKGIVHRDLKPDNVFVVPDADLPLGVRIKVLDFGIAKLSGDGDAKHKTRTGAVIGTPAYMSPEQCRGAGHVDSRSDIYSLGCMMFEMACGHPPYLGEGPGDIIGAHIYSPVPQLSIPLSPALDELITRMLQKAPDERPQSMADVVALLGAVRTSVRVVVATSTPTPTMTASEDARTVAVPPVTTLGGAASEISQPVPRQARPGWLLPAALVIAAGVAVGGYYSLVHSASSSIAAPSASIASQEPAGAESKAEALVQPKLVASPRIKLTIDSQPSGAEVYRAVDGVRVGQTPMVEDIARGTGEAVYVLKLHGYRDERVVASIDRDLNKIVALEKLTHRLPVASKSPAAPAKSSKPVKNAVLDPFEN